MARSRENFVRLAEKRTEKILDALSLLGNLSNRSNYSYEEDDIAKIFDTIQKRLKITKQRFVYSRTRDEAGSFKL